MLKLHSTLPLTLTLIGGVDVEAALKIIERHVPLLHTGRG